MPPSLRKRRAKQESEPPSASTALQPESESQESHGHNHDHDHDLDLDHEQEQEQEQEQDPEEALFAGMELDDWKWGDRDRRTASASPTKRPRLIYEPAHYVDFDPGSPSEWRPQSPSRSPSPSLSQFLTQSQTQPISHSPRPSASPTRALAPGKGEKVEGHSAFEAFEAFEPEHVTLSEGHRRNGIANDQDIDSSVDDQGSEGSASDHESDSTVDNERSKGTANDEESDGDSGDLSFESESEEVQDTHGSVQEKQEGQEEQEEQEEQENVNTETGEDIDSAFWGDAGVGTKYRQEIKEKLENLILRQTYIGTVAPNRREIQSMPVPLYLTSRSYPKTANRTLEEEVRLKRYRGSAGEKKQQRERRLARLEQHRNKGETQEQRTRYSSQCTSCIIQGLECSGHKPICSQCHQSSSATTATLSSKTAVPSSIRVLPSDTAPGFCSYPVEGDLIIAPDMYKRLKEAIPKAATSSLNEAGMSRLEIANVIPKLTSRRDDSTDAGWVVGVTKKHASLISYRPQLDKNPAANADYLLDIRFKRPPQRDTNNPVAGPSDGVKEQRNSKWSINRQSSESQLPSEMSTEAPRPRNRSRLARTLDRRLLALPRHGSRSGGRKEIQQKTDEWVVNETNTANGNKRREDGMATEDGDDDVDHDDARGAPKRRFLKRYNPGQQNQELFKDLNPQSLVGDTAVYRLAETLDDDHTVYLGLDKTTQDALFVNRRRNHLNVMAANFRQATAASIRQLGWAGSEHREDRDYEKPPTVHPRVEVSMDGVQTYRKIKTFKSRKGWTKAAAKVRKINSRTFRPWVPEKGEEILPSVCDVPGTSLLQALHHYASYFYTHAYPCPDVFEALDLPSHIALAMIIQEVISDFAFKLGKESQLEDLEVLEERLTAEKIFGKVQIAADTGNGADIANDGASTGPEEEEDEEDEEDEEEEEEEREKEMAVAAAEGSETGYRFSPRPTFAFDSSEEEEEEVSP
ncbi:hypothetical protein BGZ67_004514 [Mortierella alpina]|nr:hypothetical protein BGZ67_004514 [Mortierella alpina]